MRLTRGTRRRLILVVAVLVSPGCSGDDAGDATVSSTAEQSTTPDSGVPSVPAWADRLTGYFEADDGTELHYSVLLPAGEGPHPVIMNYSGYDAGSIGGTSYLKGDTAMSPPLDALLLDAGYAVLGVNMRGTGCSDGGGFDLFSPYWGTDKRDAVEWAAAQEWSDGSIGMANWSYAGISQLFTASETPDHLKAIAPGMVVTDPLRDVGSPGGVPNVLFPNGWWIFIQENWEYAHTTAQDEGDQACIDRIDEHLALSENTSPPAMQAQHPFQDEFNDSRLLWTRTDRIDVPVLSMEAWQDGATGVRGGYYQDTVDPNLLWYVGTNGGHDMYESRVWQEHLIRFFDHFVKGDDNRFADEPRVQIWQDATGPGAPLPEYGQLTDAEPGWVISADDFAPEVEATTFWLHSDGTLAETAPGGQGDPTSYSFPVPGPTVNAALDQDGGSWSTQPPSTIGSAAFTTAPLEEDLVLFGSASADLWVASTATDTDLQVTVTEVRPDGQEQYVQRGWLRMSQRALDEEHSNELRPFHPLTEAAVEPLTPGDPSLGRVEIQKFSYAFREGSRIRIWIDTPNTTGEQGFTTLDSPATNTIVHDADHPSKIVFGALSDASTPRPQPDCGRILSQPCRPDPLADAG